MTESFLHLPANEKRKVFEHVARTSGQESHLPEKDIRVVRAIRESFAAPFGEDLVFKGGTSLSKGYDAIGGFPKMSAQPTTSGRLYSHVQRQGECLAANTQPGRKAATGGADALAGLSIPLCMCFKKALEHDGPLGRRKFELIPIFCLILNRIDIKKAGISPRTRIDKKEARV